MGKASRRKKVSPQKRQNVRPAIPFVDRPFAGLPRERELVAMREIIPCAVMDARTNDENGALDFQFVSLLPDGAGAVVRTDGQVLVGLQTRFSTGDLSHDLGCAINAAQRLVDAGEVGVAQFDVRDPGPRLQDILDLESLGEMQVLDSFEFWLDPTEELGAEQQAALEQNRQDMVPTSPVPGAEGMYWCQMNNNFVRYVLAVDEDKLFTALGRLQAAGQATLGPDSKFVGAFRACGISIPVFQVDPALSAADLSEPASQLADAVAAALEVTTPLSDAERRARAGMVSRQVTIR